MKLFFCVYSIEKQHMKVNIQVQRIEELSELLDGYPRILDLVARDFDKANVASTGACGLSIKSILRCLVLKQTTPLSDHKLAFHWCDSPAYRAFARLRAGQSPGKPPCDESNRTRFLIYLFFVILIT